MMGLLDLFFRREPASAAIAKQRLQSVLMQERASRDSTEFLPLLKRELVAVVAKYVTIREDMIRVTLAKTGGTSVLRINVQFDGGGSRPRAIGA
ncbi:MAG TPA: cell division topological specificity factor MinE [Stellaceae bacterium]|nr:cell division topological specificity factor MinE [Stellaceae bacterium]